MIAKLAGFKEAIHNALHGLKELWEAEPIVVLSTAAAVIIFIAKQFGIVLDEGSVVEGLKLVVAVLGLGFLARRKTVPAVKVVSRKP